MGKVSLLSTEALRIDELLFQDVDQLSIKTISTEQMRVGRVPDEDTEEPQALASSDKLQITGLSWARNLIAIDGVAYESLHNRIVRDSDGKLSIVRFIDVIENLNVPPETAEQIIEGARENKSDKEQVQPVDLTIVRIQASEGSSVTFVDDSIKPPFATTEIFKQISLGQLDTRKPEQNSPLRLEGTIGKHTRLSLSGDMKPFLKPVSLDLSGTIQAVDLPRLSS